jgi:adenylate cyclase
MKRLFHPKIGAKLITLIATLLLVSLITLVWTCNRLFIEDNRALIQQMNSDTAANLASQTREVFVGLTDRAKIVGGLLLSDGRKNPMRETLLRSVFETDRDLLAMVVTEKEGRETNPSMAAFSPALTELGQTSPRLLMEALSARGLSLEKVRSGQVSILPFPMKNGILTIALTIPLVSDAANAGQFSSVLTVLFRQARLAKVFSTNDIVTSFLVDSEGKFIAHPNPRLVANGENALHLEIVQQMLRGQFGNGQTSYIEPVSDQAVLGAFRLLGFAGLGVVSEVPEAKAFEAAMRVQKRASLVGLIVLSIAFLFGYIYSDSLVWPIRQLVAATRLVSDGNFEVRLRPKSRDELGELAVAFNDMTAGLEERERVKATFNKFHNKEVAEKLLSGDVQLGGERRDATVFFSDIRGFTGLSESLQPEQVVEMLNEYMTRMVAVIRRNGGIVDKYVGDAIMAIWGVPLDNPLACQNAVTACLEMRQELAALNESRIARNLPALRIGMGLNRGPVIAGNIGSDEKMEYTVIGDSVNLASRIESMTKEFGTDLLISKTVQEAISEQFVFEPCEKVSVKGKQAEIETFKVLGKMVEGKPQLIQTPYSSYAAELSDKVVHPKAA